MTDRLPIYRYEDLLANGGVQRQLHGGIDAVFFQSSNTQSFHSDEARSQFRERWLGRYLTHDAHHALVALSPDGLVAGYLVGCLQDPARTPRFADIGYFSRFAPLTARYPAHLHVNLADRWRGRGVGSSLVKRFCDDAKAAGAPGVHVVTSRGARNVSFYDRNGFVEAGCDGSGQREVVFLARMLADG